MFNWFRKKKATAGLQDLLIDIHSHLLPGLDDGVQSVEQAEEVIRYFHSLGYHKLITSPHVMSDAYRNTTEGILHKHQELQQYLLEKKIPVVIEAAAEYYLDEQLLAMLDQKEPLLTFGPKYLLFETNFLNEPFNLKEFIFLATTQGYKPVLAHPERYLYLQNNPGKIQDLLDRGVLLQLNISSITGYYSRQVQTAAQTLIDKKCIHFLGSDCHHLQHVRLVEKARRMKYFQKAISLPLLNNTL